MKRYDAEYFAVVATLHFCNRTIAQEPTSLNCKMISRRFIGDEPREPGERAYESRVRHASPKSQIVARSCWIASAFQTIPMSESLWMRPL
ncbi:hypothetical protein SAMN05445850_3168 [Paraburkholderia tuberum]|uniref:Uncharacterized protein n=1 Tax=Paraburkholderia tuberum TaxID=157910 RepID=A0A1H1GZ08_9BURK|nr:hypothetical protein SAMN05445850_3168 [Paraburkholderia tuberum]